MLSVISNLIKISNYIKEVLINFLMSGHSVMTADSVHGVIENAVHKKTVYAPSEWLTIISNARYSPFPYNVIKMEYSDFEDWKAIADSMKFIVELGGKEKLKISQVRTATFKKNLMRQMQFEVTFSASHPEKRTVTIKPKRNRKFKTRSPKYSQMLPISTKKYNDLINLCCTKCVIPQHFHEAFASFELRVIGIFLVSFC